MANDKTLTYHSKLVGVTYEGRQDVIATLRGKEPLRVRREADNKYDSKAVAVDVYKNDEWLPIGYIAKDKNEDISKALDAKESVYISIASISGGGDKAYGVNISLEYKTALEAEKTEKPKVTKAEARRVLEHLLGMVGGNAPVTHVEASVSYSSPLTGESIDLQEVNGHKRLEGFTSGSMFPDQFYQEFDSKGISEAMAEKFGVDINALLAMWKINSEASTGYGTAVHAALENYDRNFELGDKVKKVETFKTKPPRIGPNKALNRNAFLKKIVEDFHIAFGGDYERINELFIWDTAMQLCGSIDRLKIIDRKKKICRVQDFKTDADIHEKTYQLTTSPFKKAKWNDDTLLCQHWLQLSFYAFVLQLKGWTVEGLDIYWLNPEKLVKGEQAWEEFSSEVIDISEVILNG